MTNLSWFMSSKGRSIMPRYDDQDHLPISLQQDTFTHDSSPRKISIIDGMGLFQSMKKIEAMQTMRDFCYSFIEKLMSITCEYVVIIVVLDTYRDSSLKSATRKLQLHGAVPIQYKIEDTTSIKKRNLKALSITRENKGWSYIMPCP